MPESIGGKLNNIAGFLVSDPDYPFNDTLLICRVVSGAYSASVYKDLGNQIVYRDAQSGDVADLVYELWEMENPKKRWARMELTIHAGKFEASFIFPEEIPKDDDFLEYRNRVIRRVFGGKPVVYPPLTAPDGSQIFHL